MKNGLLRISFLALAVAMAAVGCQPKEDKNSAGLSKTAVTQLAKSQETWNSYLGESVKMEGYAVIGTINDAVTKEEVLASISNPKAMMAYGNLEDRAGVKIGSLENLAAAGNKGELLNAQQTILSYADTAIQIGDQIVEIQWSGKVDGHFTSLCIVRASGLVWDNLLTGVVIIKEDGLHPPSQFESMDRATTKTYQQYWNVYWIGGGLRGQIGYTIMIRYYCSTNKVCSTDRTDWGNMALGSVQSESKILVNSGAAYGQIQYALGLATPVASVTFNNASFSVSVSGIGSSIIQNGTKSLYP